MQTSKKRKRKQKQKKKKRELKEGKGVYIFASTRSGNSVAGLTSFAFSLVRVTLFARRRAFFNVYKERS